MITVAEALERLFALTPPPPVEEVPLREAAARVLLRPLAARRDQPPFDASAMDGYALRAADARPGARLRVVGESPAGQRWPGRLGPGEAVRILTGAPIPQGADAVVMQEEAPREGDWLTIRDTAVAAHVRRRGADFAAGARLDPPRRLTPAEVALLAAFGHGAVPVARRPVVAVLSTGDELVMPGEEPGADQVFASNAFGLAAMIEAEGGEARILPIAPDDEGALDFAFDLAEGCDLLLTIGGASVGDRDLVAPVAQARGAELSFHKVAMRPGKPLLAGRLGSGTPLLGLPGNPVSAMVCGTLFLLPMVRAMQGLPRSPAPRRRAPLAVPLPPGGPRDHYLRARLGPDGRVEPFPSQDSSLLTVLAQAHCLLLHPAGAPAMGVGEAVEIVPLRPEGP